MALTTFTGPVVSQNGFLDSSFTTAERDAIVNPQPGLLIYNTTDNVYEVCTVGGATPTWDTAFGGGAAPITWTKGVEFTTSLFFGNPSSGPAYIALDSSSAQFAFWQSLQPGTTVTVLTEGSVSGRITPIPVTVTISGPGSPFSSYYEFPIEFPFPPGFNFFSGNDIGSMEIVPVLPAPPNITSVSPSSGGAGVNMTINGTGFDGTTSVTIGGVSASFFYMAPVLFVTVPSGLAPGPADVTVTTPAGSSTEVGAFTYTAPSSTTYTEGVFYSPGGVSRSGGGSGTTINIYSSDWTSSTAFNDVLAQPSGTVFTVVQDGVTYTITTYTGWSPVSPGQFSITGFSDQYGPGGNITSISFPA